MQVYQLALLNRLIWTVRTLLYPLRLIIRAIAFLPKLPYWLTHHVPQPLALMFNMIRSKVHGDARWLTAREARRFFSSSNEGFVFSPEHRLGLKETNRHLAILAPSGGGKTVRFVIQNLLKSTGSVIVTDPSGEIFKTTSGAMKAKGRRIEVLSPADPKLSRQYNPLIYRHKVQDFYQLAVGLLDRIKSEANPFWSDQAVTPLYLAFCALKAMPDQSMATIPNARLIINRMLSDADSIAPFMAMNLSKDQFEEYSAFMGQDWKVVSGVLGSAQAALSLWLDPDVAEFTAGNTIDLSNLRKQKTIIYIIIPEDKIEHYGVLLNLFYADCFSLCYREPDGEHILMLLDEFGNIGKVENFGNRITTLRKYNCALAVVLQSPLQLEDIYGTVKAKKIWQDGLVTKVFLAGLGDDTCDQLERKLGSTTEYDTGFGGISDKARTIKKALMTTDQIRTLDEDQCIVITGNKRPALLKTVPYWLDHSVKAMLDHGTAEIDFLEAHTPVKYLDFPSQADVDSLELSAVPAFVAQLVVPQEVSA